MPAPRAPIEDGPFSPTRTAAPPPIRVPDGNSTRPERHVLRPAEEYVEFEEELGLHIPREMFPPGFDLQWVTYLVWGRPEPKHRARFQRAGWVAVHQEDFENRYRGMFMPAEMEGEITMDGLVLMARSEAWSRKAKMNEQRRAFERVAIKEHQLRQGALNGITLDPGHKTAVATNIVERHVDTIAVPQNRQK